MFNIQNRASSVPSPLLSWHCLQFLKKSSMCSPETAYNYSRSQSECSRRCILHRKANWGYKANSRFYILSKELHLIRLKELLQTLPFLINTHITETLIFLTDVKIYNSTQSVVMYKSEESIYSCLFIKNLVFFDLQACLTSKCRHMYFDQH